MTSYKEVDDLFVSKHKSKINLLIVTATATEKETLHKYLKPIPGYSDILKIQVGKHTYFVGQFGAFYAVHVACNEMGSTGRSSSIVTTSDAINTWSPSVVLMVGIAFGKDETKQEIGDVLVSERIIPYEPKRLGKDETISRAKEGPASSLLFDRFKSVTGWDFKQEERAPEIIYGGILSGEKLVDDPAFKAELFKDHPEAIGGEMEGAGIYAACDQKVNDWILVKGICDWGENKDNPDKKKHQVLAIESAVDLCAFVFNSPFGFKDVSLVAQDEVLKTDFSEDRGAIPEWMLKKEKSLAKEIRNED